MSSDRNMVLIDETLPLRRRIHNDPSAAPWGMLEYDRGALSSSQQEDLNYLKTSLLRRENRRYLVAHPQVTAVVSVILRAVYLHRPIDPKKFIAELVERSDFEDKVHHYLLRRGRNSQDKRSSGKDLFSCIQPHLLVSKEAEVHSEKQRTRLNIPDEDIGLGPESIHSADSSSSIDSFRVFSAIGEEATIIEKKLDEIYRKKEESVRKAAKNNLKFESSNESILKIKPTEVEDSPLFTDDA